MSDGDAIGIDVAKAMWYFYTPTVPWRVQEFTPKENQPPIPVALPIPLPTKPLVDVSINARFPQYNEPNYWTKPFDMSACTCCAFYKTWTPVLFYDVGSTEMLIITGVSYELPGLPINSLFRIQLLRDGDVIADWEDMRVKTTGNPAGQYAFSGHVEQIPQWTRIDRNQRLTARILLMGVSPYPLDSSTQYSGNICIYVHGFRPAIFDNRDGAARPSEAGELAQAELQPLRIAEQARTTDAAQLAKQLDGFLQFMLTPDVPGKA